MNKTVIVSSHILPELADVCTRVGMIEKGNMIVDGYVDEVMRKARQQILLYIRVKTDQPRAAKLLEQHPDVSKIDDVQGTLHVLLKPDVLDYSPLSALLTDSGLRLTLFREEEVNLETAFLALTKGLVQ